MNKIKKRLAAGESVIGTWLNSGSPIIGELLSACGFDFVCVDAEHSAVDIVESQRIFQAISSGNSDCESFVRLHGIDYSLVKRYVDAGATGIIGPLVNCKEDAELLVKATKYPPVGLRGVGFCRGNKYGLEIKTNVKEANNEVLVAVQIEHIDGVKRIDEILSVPEIDAVFIGPYDLSASMNITGEFDHPDFVEARNTILEACNRHKITPGVHVIQPDIEELSLRKKEGYRLLAYSLDITMIMKLALDGINSFKKENV